MRHWTCWQTEFEVKGIALSYKGNTGFFRARKFENEDGQYAKPQKHEQRFNEAVVNEQSETVV